MPQQFERGASVIHSPDAPGLRHASIVEGERPLKDRILPKQPPAAAQSLGQPPKNGRKHMNPFVRCLLVTAAIQAATITVATGAFANDDIMKNQKDPANWALQLGNYAGQRYSTLDQITRDNVKNLRPVWQFSTGVLRGHEGGPIVVGDTMYISTPFPNIVYALDLNDNGRIKWKYEPKQDSSVIPVMCCDTVTRGVAVAGNKLFLGQADNTLVALDTETGKVVWSAKNGDATKGETLTAAPLVVKDKVYVGISGGEFGVRGHLTAYDINTGKMVWRAYSTGPDKDVMIDPQKTMMLGKPIGEPDLGIKTWPADQWKIGGGTTWGWYTYDPELNLIYYGTGNPGTWNPTQRAVDKDRAKSDNKWSMTIFARDADTGQAKWVFQKTPFDEWDYDGVNENILADVTVGGTKHKALINFDRNGFAYTIDRTNGELLVAQKYDPSVNWASEIDMKTGRPKVNDKYSTFAQGEDHNTTGICPAALGSKDQQPASYSPDSGLLYVPTNHISWITSRSRSSIPPDSPMSARRSACIRLRIRMAAWAISSPGIRRPARSSGRSRALRGVERRPVDQGRHRLLRDSGRLSEGVRPERRQGPVQLQDLVRHHRQRQHLHAQGQAVYRRAVGRRRLGGHRAGGRTDRRAGRPGRGRRTQGAGRIHPAGRHADRLRAARQPVMCRQ